MSAATYWCPECNDHRLLVDPCQHVTITDTALRLVKAALHERLDDRVSNWLSVKANRSSRHTVRRQGANAGEHHVLLQELSLGIARGVGGTYAEAATSALDRWKGKYGE